MMASLRISYLILIVSILLSLAVAENVIVSGATWTDTSGNVIQAHGGGFLKVNHLVRILNVSI